MRLRTRQAIWAISILALPGAYLATKIHRHHSPPPAPAPPAPGLHVASPQNPLQPNVCSQLYRTICQKRGETLDPTGAVKPDVDGEIQALRTYEKIIHEHPDWSSEQVDQKLVETIYTPKRLGRLRSAYQWVAHTLEQIIRRQPDTVFTSTEKKRLIARLRKTELQVPPPVSNYADEPDLFTKNDVFYERTISGRMRMRVGGAYLLTAKSWFNIVFTLAHEFAHAIDPCELKAENLNMPAYDRVSSCFIDHGLVAARKTRKECGENDQLSETFADWMAVQVVSEALRNFATEFHGPQVVSAAMNSVRDLCDQSDEGDNPPDLEFHPSPEIRIDQIFARNPNIREVLGCAALATPTPDYCSFEYQPQTPPRGTPPEHL